MGTQGAVISFVRCADPPHQWPPVSVCVTRVSATQLHVGIGYRIESDLRLLHLAWHLKLTDAPLCDDPNYLGIRPNIPVMRQEEVALACERIYATNGRSVPYSFSAPNGCFDATTGDALFGPTKTGLTCATFVLAVFDSVGISLLKYDSWPAKREGDDEWRAFVIEELGKAKANAAHLDAVLRESPGTRYRPDDVAAAAAAYPPSATFDATRPAVTSILANL